MTNLNDVLAARGILNAAQAAQWIEYTHKIGDEIFPGWRIPVWGRHDDASKIVAYRWKNGAQDVKKGEKARWIPSKPKNLPYALYYLLPDTIDAIQDRRRVILAGGEPDVLTFRAAGALNALCYFDGEGSVPPTFAQDMIEMGALEVVMFPDRDDKGILAAQKVTMLCQAAGLSLDIRELPFLHTDAGGGDINQLWIDLRDYDKSEFWQRLADAPALEFPMPTHDEQLAMMQQRGPRDHRGSQSGGGDNWQAYLSEIKTALASRDTQQTGNITRFQCVNPTHPDQHPSARISYDIDGGDGVYVCNCGTHKWITVGDWLGIGTFREWVRENDPGRNNPQREQRKRFDSAWEEPPPFLDQEPPPYDDEDHYLPAEPPAPPQPAPAPILMPPTHDIMRPGITHPHITERLLHSDIDPLTIDLGNIEFSSRDAAALYEARKTGAVISDFPPVPFLFQAFHYLEGLGKAATGGDLYGFLGLSGFGKTSFLEALMDAAMQAGDDCLVVSPEIPWWKFADRAAQRWGGLTVTESLIDDLARYEQHHGIERTHPIGRLAEPQAVKEAIDHVLWWGNWPGAVYILDQFGANAEEWFATIEASLIAHINAGKPIRRFFLDYVQLLTPPANWRGNTSYEEIILRLKTILMRYGVVGYVTSQVRKADTREVLDGSSARMSQDAGMNLRDFQFKFFATMMPGFKPHPSGDPDRQARANYTTFTVTKNSEGRENTDIEIEVDWKRMLFKDHRAGHQRGNLAEEPSNQ
jgi:hypothetical protein